jgi:hypothetical protein
MLLKSRLMKTLLVSFIVVILLTSCAMFEKDSNGDGLFDNEPTPDPWEVAIDDSKGILSRDDGFEDRLSEVKSQASTISDKIAVVEQAQPALDLLDSLHEKNIPVLGNAYDVLIQGLEVAQPGAGEALTMMEDGLRELIEIKGLLDSLNSLNNLIFASDDFRNHSSVNSLVSLDHYIESSLPSLNSLDGKLSDALRSVDDVQSSIDTIQTAISYSSALFNTPIVGDALSMLSGALNTVATPVDALSGLMSDYHSDLSSSISTMDGIHDAVAIAQSQDPVSFSPSPDQEEQEAEVAAADDRTGSNSEVSEPTEEAAEEEPVIATEEPTEEPTAVVVETEPPSVSYSPVDMVYIYWNSISDHNFETAWMILSEGFQDRNHDGYYSEYAQDYVDMNVCQIDTENGTLLEQSGNNAVVYAQVIYYVGSSCTKSEYEFDFYMIYDLNRELWLIDRVMYAD